VEFVDALVLGLVDDIEVLEVHSTEEDSLARIRVVVSRGDIGKVIGKQGRTARSLRTIVCAAARKRGLRCEMDIRDHESLQGDERVQP
jgi:predicted RNA-binding protein YlqC (UPF0109 family)